MADWSIKIVPAKSGGGAAFQPNLAGFEQGDPLPAQQGDLVSWSNRTADTHQPWPTDANYNPMSEADVLPRGGPNYMSDPIPPDEPSTPAYNVAQTTTIYYYCKLHPDIETERGTIDATAIPTVPQD